MALNENEIHNPEQVLSEIMARLHRRWRLATILPLGYMGLGLLINRLYFEPSRGGAGFIPLGDTASTVALFLGGALVIFLWMLLNRLTNRQGALMAPVAGNQEEFFSAAKDAQLAQLLICDLASAPGVVLFLMNGDLVVLAIFCLTSLVFYLKALPSERRVGDAFFGDRSV